MSPFQIIAAYFAVPLAVFALGLRRSLGLRGLLGVAAAGVSAAGIALAIDFLSGQGSQGLQLRIRIAHLLCVGLLGAFAAALFRRRGQGSFDTRPDEP